MKYFVDYTGLKTFKESLDKEIKQIIGLGAGETVLKYAEKSDIDDVMKSEEVDGNKIVKLNSFAYYNSKINSDIKTKGTELNTSVNKVIADAFVVTEDEEGKEVKSDAYVNVENMIDEKMTWKLEFPEKEIIQ